VGVAESCMERSAGFQIIDIGKGKCGSVVHSPTVVYLHFCTGDNANNYSLALILTPTREE